MNAQAGQISALSVSLQKERLIVMNQKLRMHANEIISRSIRAVQPDEAVSRALAGKEFPGRVLLVAAGKAAWQMAKAANDCLGDRIEAGVVVTKYDHVKAPIANYICCEAGHPVPDENSFAGTQKALDLVSGLSKEDTVLFLLSGGGSALFEKPLIPGSELQDVTGQLLACGADIEGVGTDCLCITGGNVLRGTQYTVPADRIVAGTYLFACLAAGGNILLEEAPTEQMASVIELASSMGAECQKAQNGLYVQAPERLRGVRELITLPYPDFPTDLQSVALTAMTAADGECLIEETIFENRFRVVEPLQEMGADIRKLDAARVIVKGPVRLKGCKVEAVELRGGAALVVAGLIAEGETVIRGCRYIGRGYENICRDLRELGARIYSV